VLPPVPFAKSGVYLKLRDRASYAFALISVAAAFELLLQKENRTGTIPILFPKNEISG
jgi:CO/xanthine dehydrogenase FAD-binding subunit